jgi:hypothetical protein
MTTGRLRLPLQIHKQLQLPAPARILQSKLDDSARRQVSGSWLNPLHLTRATLTTKKEMGLENQRNLELDDQGGYDVPPSGCGKLGCGNVDMGPLGFLTRCEYSSNGGHSSLPLSRPGS